MNTSAEVTLHWPLKGSHPKDCDWSIDGCPSVSPPSLARTDKDEATKETVVTLTLRRRRGDGQWLVADSSDDSGDEDERSLSCQFNLNLSDYDTVDVLGNGSFGRVFLVRQKGSADYYALKVLNICRVVRKGQVGHVHSEKSILHRVDHPFIVHLYRTWKDRHELYMLMDYYPGGELFSYLRALVCFPNSTGQFYSAEIVLALEYLHGLNIVFRDLKPENLLLDREGHLKITDFGFAKELTDRTWTICGTPEYLAPEIVINKGHNRAVDWWALGVLIFEFLAGYTPFSGHTVTEIYESILQGTVKFPSSFNLVAKDLVKKLLKTDRTCRLGCMKNGAYDVKNHNWFRSISWNELYDRKLTPPIVPTVRHEGDTANFFKWTNMRNDDEFAAVVDTNPCSSREFELFDGW